MADKLMSGIGRELRYMEYKLRKKHSEWDKERKKTSKDKSDKKVPSMKEFTSDQVSPDLANALPTDTKEEDLQIQVALAISKEEMNEAERREESDRVRLELALKQSEAAMAEAESKLKLKQQQQQQQSAPSTSSNDPWGSATGEPHNSFDPFSGAGPSTSSASSPWESSTLAKPPAAAQVVADPWSQGVASQATKDRNDSFSDLFGAGSTSAAPAAPQVDPWGGGQAEVAVQPKFDPFQASAAPASAAPAPTSTPAFEGFTTPSTPQQAFDPLSEFDNLHLGNFNGGAVQPVAAQSLTTMPPVAMDPFVLEPLPVSNSTQQLTSPQTNEPANNGKAGSFLEGNMSSLIDMNSLLPSKAATNPYTMTKPSTNTTTNARNPFMLKSPAPSLNQLQSSGNQGMFGDSQQDFGGLLMQPAAQSTQISQQNFFAQPTTASSNNPFPTAQNPF